jgi:hypothetical protein
VGQSVYAIDGFPDDDLLWRIEWLGGVGYNTSVPSEPQIDVSLAQLPRARGTRSAREHAPQVEKRTVKIGVGLLPYIWIGSVWQKRRPVMKNLAAYRSLVSIDTTSFRMVALGMATSLDNAIPTNSYLFGASWPHSVEKDRSEERLLKLLRGGELEPGHSAAGDSGKLRFGQSEILSITPLIKPELRKTIEP